jgi:hypothetical protein
MQNPSTDRYAPPTSANKYSASVPISVYRELAAELQAAQTTIGSLKSQNQKLVKQNQQLQQQVDKVVQSAQYLQEIIGSFSTPSQVDVPRPKPVTPPEPRHTSPPAPHRPVASTPAVEFPSSFQDSEPESPYSETVVIEQEAPRSRRTSHSEALSDINGWMLLVAILLIVLTAFGTGFLIVRPLLNNNKR